MKKLSTLLVLLFFAPAFFAQDIYFPPEFEKQEGLLLTWDYNDQRNPVTAAIAKAVQPSAKVWIVYYPGTAPMDTTQIRTYLRDHNVPDENVFLIPAWTETLWIRDYGPLAVYDFENGFAQRTFLDAGYSAYGRPNDDAIPTQLANLMQIPALDFPLQFEGGNVLVDGLGRGWSSTRIFSQNPDMTPAEVKNSMETFLGLDEMMFLEALLQSGGGIWCHVDMFMKILDSETILISEYPDFVPDYELIESFADTLSKMTNANGRAYKVVRIPAPPKADGSYATTQNDEMRTYTNAIIINDVIVVPAYNLPEYDSIARAVYAENMPGYRIQMVDATPLTPLYGALHCICKEITKADYLRINHAKLSGIQDYSESVQIHAEIFSIHPLDSAFVAYRKNNQPDFENVLMSLEGDSFVAELQNIAPGDTIEYYIGATANDDLVVIPPPAPQGYFTFYFDPSLRLAALNNANPGLLISPNPSSGDFQVSLSTNSAQGQLMILEMSGRVVFSCEINAAKHSLRLHNTLSPGIYAAVFVDQKGKMEISKLLIY